MLIIDKYAYHNRLLGVNPMVKLGLYVLMLGLSFSGILSLKLGLIACLIPLTCYVAKLHWKTYLKWLLVTLPFVFLSLVTIMVTYAKSAEATLWHVQAFGGYLGISRDSLDLTIRLLSQVYASLVSTYFFILTVPFQQLILIFRTLKMPKELLEIMVLMYCFIFMFIQEFMVMRDTLDLKFAFGSFRQSYQSMGLLGGQLFTRLMKANEHLLQMLELRFDS